MITNTRATPTHFTFVTSVGATDIRRRRSALEQKFGFIIGESWSVLSTKVFRIIELTVLNLGKRIDLRLQVIHIQEKLELVVVVLYVYAGGDL